MVSLFKYGEHHTVTC